MRPETGGLLVWVNDYFRFEILTYIILKSKVFNKEGISSLSGFLD